MQKAIYSSLSVILLNLLCYTLISQESELNRTNHWFFGDSCHVDFSGETPVAYNDGSLYTLEGCSAISDLYGNLLFYTDGMRVYDAQNEQMPNGYGLHGEFSSLNSALIVPKPDDSKIYYIFTTPSYGGAGLNYSHMAYSVVDLSLREGLGDVTLKNIELLPTSAEQLGAVHHKNETDYWVVGHELHNDKFYAFLVTENGVSQEPVVSEVGVYFQTIYEYSVSGFKFSPSGCKAVSTYANLAMFQIFDFDNEHGKLFNPITINIPWPWGACFSPDCRYLYIGMWDTESISNPGEKIFQFDISNTTAESIFASRKLISQDVAGSQAQMQLARDGKIYCSIYQSEYIAVINEPNNYSHACDFVAEGLYLAGSKSLAGITNFVQSFVRPKDQYYADCPLYETIGENQSHIARLFPNPFSDKTILYFNKSWNNVTLTVFDASGKEVFQANNISGDSYTINRNKLETGLYILQIQHNGIIIDSIKMLVN